MADADLTELVAAVAGLNDLDVATGSRLSLGELLRERLDALRPLRDADLTDVEPELAFDPRWRRDPDRE